MSTDTPGEGQRGDAAATTSTRVGPGEEPLGGRAAPCTGGARTSGPPPRPPRPRPRVPADAQKRIRLVEFWSRQMMIPEWMTEPPATLATEWLVLARPEGVRCLVVSGAGWTVARKRSGALLARFRSGLPGGGRGADPAGGVGCILDCVFDQPRATFWVTDVLLWRGLEMEDCGADFRLFWVRSKEQEGLSTGLGPAPGGPSGAAPGVPGGGAGPRSPGGSPLTNNGPGGVEVEGDGRGGSVRAVPFWAADEAGVREAYGSGALGYDRDGLLFVHRGMMYAGGGTPLALLWKDGASSRYFIETDAGGGVPRHQSTVLRLRMDGTVATEDDPPVVVARMPAAFMDAQRTGPGRPLGPEGRLLRFTVREGGITLVDGAPAGADLKLEGVGNQKRGRADSWSKIVFQHLARTRPLTIAAVLAAAGGEGGEGGMADG